MDCRKTRELEDCRKTWEFEDYNLLLEVCNQYLEVYNYLLVQHKIVLVDCKDFGFVLDSLHGMVDGNLFVEILLLNGVVLEVGSF